MREISANYVKQHSGEPFRRWFEDDYFNLFVWQDLEGSIVSFQLIYDKVRDQHAFIWDEENGYSHEKVDDGEGQAGRHKASPILMAGGRFKAEEVASLFQRESLNIEASVASFVLDKITSYNKH